MPDRWGSEYADCIHCRKVRPLPPQKKERYPEYDTELYLMARFWRSEKCEVPLSLPLFPGPLWPGKVSSAGQIDLFWKFIRFEKFDFFLKRNEINGIKK